MSAATNVEKGVREGSAVAVGVEASECLSRKKGKLGESEERARLLGIVGVNEAD